MMSHIQITVDATDELSEMLIAELSQLGYDSFLEDDQNLVGSITEELFSEEALTAMMERYKNAFPLTYKWEKVAPQNWNKLWESNYPYVIVNDRCAIKAAFHTLPKKYEYEIEITPKMSFGTGNHATTTLMLQSVLKYDFTDKSLLDLGTGTGVLFIMALMLGAKRAKACDIEEWAVENAIENAEKNKVTNYEVFQGTVTDLPSDNLYDFVLANINKNVILSELPAYANRLVENGVFMTSCFYESDLKDVEKMANANRLKMIHSDSLNNWVVGVFRKTE